MIFPSKHQILSRLFIATFNRNSIEICDRYQVCRLKIGVLQSKALNNSVTSTPVKPSAKKVNDETESDLKKIYNLIAQMNSKLDKLDQIEIHLARVDQDIKDLKHSYTFVNETADELKKNQITQDNAIKSLEESITTIKAHNLQLHQELIDVRRHTRCEATWRFTTYPRKMRKMPLLQYEMYSPTKWQSTKTMKNELESIVNTELFHVQEWLTLNQLTLNIKKQISLLLNPTKNV